MTEEKKYPSQLAERFQVRMPTGLRDRIAKAAAQNRRSMNAEILDTLETQYPEPPTTEDAIKEILSTLPLIKALKTGESLSRLSEQLDDLMLDIWIMGDIPASAKEDLREYLQRKEPSIKFLSDED